MNGEVREWVKGEVREYGEVREWVNGEVRELGEW